MITWYLWTVFLFFWTAAINCIIDRHNFRARTRTQEFFMNVFVGMVLALIAWHWLVLFTVTCVVLVPAFILVFFAREALERFRTK
jgi:hypothetical protein